MMTVEPRAWIALAMLVGAAASDLRQRRVPNRFWWPFIVAAGIFVASDLRVVAASADPLHEPATLAYLVAVALCGLFYLLFRVRAFGGGDAKGLMLLAFLVPAAPSGIPLVLASLVVGSVGIILIPLGFAVVNAARGHVALPAMLLGFRMDARRAAAWKVWPMQDVDPEGRRTWRYYRMVGTDAQAALDRLVAAGERLPWVTPKLPYLAFVLLGLGWTLAADPIPGLLRFLGNDS